MTNYILHVWEPCAQSTPVTRCHIKGQGFGIKNLDFRIIHSCEFHMAGFKNCPETYCAKYMCMPNYLQIHSIFNKHN